MTDQQWQTIVAMVRGESRMPLPTAFIIDSPWLPNWSGTSILDYYADEQVYFDANMRAIRTFPDAIMLPGFWSEYGMCTEPSAFGSVSMWGENEFPFAKRVLRSAADLDTLELPNPRTDGLLPFVIKRLARLQPRIEAEGHRIRMAVSRGPLNIASFLMGTTEFLLLLKTDPGAAHRLLSLVTDFMVDWIAWQRECFPSIDGLLVLDDIVGFISGRDFETFGLPYLTRVFDTDMTVKFFHNDAPCKACAPFLPGIGINLLNFGVQHTLAEMRAWTDNRVTLLGNLPPRDVLAKGTPADVARGVQDMLAGLGDDLSRIVVSCGGGMPPGVPTCNITAFIEAVNSFSGAAVGV
jgi:uroporphyrinogen decarboxylase